MGTKANRGRFGERACWNSDSGLITYSDWLRLLKQDFCLGKTMIEKSTPKRISKLHSLNQPANSKNHLQSYRHQQKVYGET